MKHIINTFLFTTTALILTSCAPGAFFSLTSGASTSSVWSMRANEADNLTAEGEQKLIRRIKNQLVVPQVYVDVRKENV